MADIFISYSSKDRAQAEQLTELLASAGLSVWIDQSGIDAATSWSGEIVDAIEGCKAFVVLLSPNSIESVNVVKEVSLAAEQKKKILPLDLEPVELPRDLKYHLAGLQRAPMSNIDAIIRALGKLGLEATQAPTMKLVKETDGRKSLMILPFEDLSPTGDNAWFADGIVSEMISALSNVKSLRLANQQETKGFKNFKGHLTTYAREMQIQYFVQGSVRKFGDQIKITAQLLDIDTGDYLWQHSLKGTMENIFDIQEEVARQVLKGLEVHLTAKEKNKLIERGTENVEAYELYLKAREYSSRRTLYAFRIAIDLFSRAIKLDAGYVGALYSKAFALTELYNAYDRNPKLLVEAELLARKVAELKNTNWGAYHVLLTCYRLQGRLAEAEEAALEYVRRAPEHWHSHFALGHFYMETNQPLKAIPNYEKAVELNPSLFQGYYNIVLVSDQAYDFERVTKWSVAALPLFERKFRLSPDDETLRVVYSRLLGFAGQSERAISTLEPLLSKKNLDGNTCYNIACLYSSLADSTTALTMLRRSVDAGYLNIEIFRRDQDLDPLRPMPEFQKLMNELEEKVSKVKSNV